MSKTTADLLDEYGSALRGDWGGIDGRSEQMSLWDLSEAIREHGNSTLTEPQVQKLREDLGVCSWGLGHWLDYCDDRCENEGNDAL